MKMFSILSSIALAALMSATALTAVAQTEPGQPPAPQAPEHSQVQPNAGHPHHPPPQEALDACNGKAEQESCSFVGKLGDNVTGNCRKGPDGQGPLACAPLHPPGDAINGGGAGKAPM